MEYSMKQLAAVLLLALASAMIVTAQDFAQNIVDAHNAVRANVSVGPVAWDDTVAAYAQTYADKRAADCQLVPSQGGPYGENLFLGSGIDWVPADVLNLWASEKQYYDHATITCSAPAGQSCAEYTQMVWSDTMAIGCGYVVCDGDVGVFGICSYNPPGNVAGQTLLMKEHSQGSANRE